ncbi:MAG: hypothetical protein IPI52_14975 [Bacteroidetes bacterium]|nr:hypothetical protein [Bacteroidota bacterium]
MERLLRKKTEYTQNYIYYIEAIRKCNSANQIAEATIDDLLDLFFEVLGTKRIVFVFDNIDAYIEFENFQLIGAVQKLYKAALNKNHCSKFIFTCRSSISDVDTELLSIKLQGLTFRRDKKTIYRL